MTANPNALPADVLAVLRRDAESWIMIGGERILPLLDAFDSVTERLAYAESGKDALEAEANKWQRAALTLEAEANKWQRAALTLEAERDALAEKIERVRAKCVQGCGFAGWYALARPILAILDGTEAGR